jgi:hypothetical protein
VVRTDWIDISSFFFCILQYRKTTHSKQLTINNNEITKNKQTCNSTTLFFRVLPWRFTTIARHLKREKTSLLPPVVSAKNDFVFKYIYFGPFGPTYRLESVCMREERERSTALI